MHHHPPVYEQLSALPRSSSLLLSEGTYGFQQHYNVHQHSQMIFLELIGTAQVLRESSPLAHQQVYEVSFLQQPLRSRQ